MNDIEKEAYIEMAVMFVWGWRPVTEEWRDPGLVVGLMYHDYMSVFENYCSILGSLGFAEGIWPENWCSDPDDPRPGYMQPPAYKLLYTPEEARNILEKNIPEKVETFEYALVSWIEFFEQFPPEGVPCLSKGPELFDVPLSYSKVICLLEKLGYCEKINDQYGWTDKVKKLYEVVYPYG